jgi:hypothetical protein
VSGAGGGRAEHQMPPLSTHFNNARARKCGVSTPEVFAHVDRVESAIENVIERRE